MTEPAAEMLARAFADDPAMAWLFPDPAGRRAALPRLFALLLWSDARAGAVEQGGDGAAIAAWRQPGRAKVPLADMARQAWPLARLFGTALPRALALEAAIARAHPPQPFLYLHILGTDPEARERGFASALVRAGLARAAAQGVPCVLETATESNLGLYRHLGFRVLREWRAKDGPIFWTMRYRP